MVVFDRSTTSAGNTSTLGNEPHYPSNILVADILSKPKTNTEGSFDSKVFLFLKIGPFGLEVMPALLANL